MGERFLDLASLTVASLTSTFVGDVDSAAMSEPTPLCVWSTAEASEAVESTEAAFSSAGFVGVSDLIALWEPSALFEILSELPATALLSTQCRR